MNTNNLFVPRTCLARSVQILNSSSKILNSHSEIQRDRQDLSVWIARLCAINQPATNQSVSSQQAGWFSTDGPRGTTQLSGNLEEIFCVLKYKYRGDKYKR